MRARGPNRRDDGLAVAVLAALAVLVIGLGLSVAGSRAIQSASRSRTERRYQDAGAQSRRAIEDALTSYFNRVRNAGAFVASGRQPSAAELRQYLAQDRTFEELPSLQSLIFVRRVDRDDAARVIEEVRAAHPDSPEVVDRIPPAAGPAYLVTDYVAGPSDYGLPVGADLSGLTSVRTLVDTSAVTGQALVATFQNDPLLIAAAKADAESTIQKVLDIDFFFAVPIFDGSGEVGFDHLVGWVGAPLAQFEEVLDGAGREQPEDIGQSLTVEVRAPGTDGNIRTTASARIGAEAPADPELSDETTLHIFGVDFALRTWSTSSTSSDRTPLAAFVLGALTSILAATVMFLRVRAAQGRRALAAERQARRDLEHAIVDSVDSAMVVLDHDGSVVMGNRRWEELARHDPPVDGRGAEVPYLRQLGPASADLAGQLASGLTRVLTGERAVVEMDVPVDHHGERHWYAVRITPVTGRQGGAVVMHTDITERQRSADDLQRRASRDGLTGLLNRTSLEARADDLLAEARRGGFPVGVLFIDLDGFKAVNDSYGHQVGDGVLRAVAAAIERTVRPGDSIGRMGGDEFVVLLGAGVSAAEIQAIASRIVFELAIPRTIDGVDVSIAASVGIALVDDPASVDRTELIRRADEAMYAAKQSGGSRFATADA